ncbi:MAG: carotenoid biosynthesis protein [Massilia sp.]
MPIISAVLLALFLALTAGRGQSDTTIMLIGSSLVMFACCWSSAIHFLGARAALRFVLIALPAGWFAEQMGSSRGWFFGEYTYTDVLGPTLGDVPVIIPLMWFALCYVAYIISNLIVWRAPVDRAPGLGNAAVMTLLAAMIVTAYDLGADPYMVFKLKAWIMTKTDGGWFGETLQGFFGWAFVTFVIVGAFRLSELRQAPRAQTGMARWQAAVPLLIYGGSMAFQIAYGYPIETRAIALFAMGIPLLCAAIGLAHWQTAPVGEPAKATAPQPAGADIFLDGAAARARAQDRQPVVASEPAEQAKV